ncbi:MULTISPECIES: cytochrome P450 [unclassified Streptomyces]|uniref:cytochrome P450 n=1 Tax=unclassified Streptomyces TaxID=2593676 RepID=UPI001F04E34F|nr:MULTISPECIES: cytochrome P450 [unclassified Streptomyces]MCH0565483.1 cytochrome P450 [Streptomyces sp. MUM 2J]MCH0569703.1 cytochrome P450 [Streptomyces sp. MUM 136J]
MTPEHHATTTDDPARTPPPGCPAHSRGPGGLQRLYGPGAENLGELYEQLRDEHGAVAPVLLHDDVPIWVVLGHAENLHMVRSAAEYSRDSRLWTPLQDGMVKPDHPLMPHIAWEPICSHAEGDEHQRLRGAVTGAMATIDHRSLRRYINRHTQRLVNRFCGKGRAELVAQYADHLPMAVMCEILGLPEEYNDRMVQAARDMLKGTETAIASQAYVLEKLQELTARRRRQPDEDFAGHLIAHPAGLTDDEVTKHLWLVLMAAYEATANLLANALRMVLVDDRFYARLNGGQMTVMEAVEQSLWDEPPFSTVFAYYAKQDTELGGRRIRKGDGLLFAPAPGNVDPRVRPDLSANMKGNRSHLAFGGGPHECPGQDIGRAIAEVGVDALLMRLPDVQLDCDEDELRHRESISSRHLVELPVRFDPKPQQDVMTPPSHGSVAPPPPAGTVVPEPATTAPPRAAAPATPAPPAATAVPPSGTAPAGPPASVAEPERPRGAWQRFLRWWRGY